MADKERLVFPDPYLNIPGMSLREYYAGKFASDLLSGHCHAFAAYPPNFAELSERAVKMTDTLLDQLRKK